MLFYLVVPLGLEEGVAAAVAAAAAATAAVSAVGLAGDGHAPLHGVPRGQVLELGHDLTTANLLRDVLGLAVRLGHAGESNPLIPLSDGVAGGLTAKEGNLPM